MNAKEKMLHNRTMKESFNKHMHGEQWPSKTYPNYEQSYNKKVKVASKPDFVEFGKTFDIAPSSDQAVIAHAYRMAVEDFFRAKAENFPTWDGLPQIKINAPFDYLATMQGGKQIGWYVQVPRKYVLSDDDKLQKLDEDLWNS